VERRTVVFHGYGRGGRIAEQRGIFRRIGRRVEHTTTGWWRVCASCDAGSFFLAKLDLVCRGWIGALDDGEEMTRCFQRALVGLARFVGGLGGFGAGLVRSTLSSLFAPTASLHARTQKRNVPLVLELAGGNA